MGVEYREVALPRDIALIEQVETSFETREVYRVERSEHGFRLILEQLPRPRLKTFPLGDLNERREWNDAWLALDGGRAVGFVATAIDPFNRRCTIWHLYVSRSRRRQGIGRQLVDLALARAVEDGATHAWLETSNLNVPGIAAYRRLGFELCGLDTMLYANTAAADEVALVLQRPLTRGT